MILAHGGNLINKVLSPEQKEEILERAHNFKTLILDEEQAKDVKNIARGVYSPLEGFLKKDDFQRVVSEMQLSDGTVWSIPIVLDISEKEYDSLKPENNIILKSPENVPLALLRDVEIFEYDKGLFAKNVFGTLDRKHPGVEGIYKMGRLLIGGEIGLLDESKERAFGEHNFTPTETRRIFKQRGWQTIVGFQTRNVPHLGHEFLQKQALKSADGLFLQPVIGEKKLEDIKDEYILASYEILIDKYFPKNKVFLGILPLKMRYAGPREAVFHALIRKNFGCTHFIVGRDHAGARDYYSPFAAQEIFNDFKKEEIGIEILKYPEVVYCLSCKNHTFVNQCSHQDKTFFSGTKLREKIKNKQKVPSYIIRPEVYNLLAQSYDSLVDALYKNKQKTNQRGFVCWFTGLPCSGKTTIADRVYEILRKKGMRVERLDGDIARQSLTKDLGFSKEDRDENIKRISFVAELLSKNGIAVIASFISPYRAQREGVRKGVENFIEIFCSAPLEVCEKRDKKGLYVKARRGEIKNFTGISDPYEEPANPEIVLETDKETIKENVNKVIKYLERIPKGSASTKEHSSRAKASDYILR